MSQSDKKRRKAFLNDLCGKFGIADPSDPRRSDAAIVFIAFGEQRCRAWLAQAGGNYEKWERIVDIKQARKKVSIPKRTRTVKPSKMLAKSTPKLKGRNKVLPKSAPKLGGRMSPGSMNYIVGPDGVVSLY